MIHPYGPAACTSGAGIPCPSPNRYFVYDSATVNSSQMLNVKNRLAEAYTCAGACTSKLTDMGFSYSARGEIVDLFEATPHSGGFYDTRASYWPNGLLQSLGGYLASGSAFVPLQTYTPDGEGRWSSVTTGGGTNVSSTGYNSSGQITGIVYGTGDSDSFGYDNAGRMHNYSFTLNGTSETGSPTWNANGTLQTLSINDPFNPNDTQTCSYSYDDLARITNANCGSVWSQTFTYDVFGNITKDGSIRWQPGYDPATNHYSLGGTSYDTDGNLTNDTFHSYTWDADARPIVIDSKNLAYDAFGRMVEKVRW
jgi:hypothetical protein